MPHIYILHYERPLGKPPYPQVQHYGGYTGRSSLKQRMEEHRDGVGSKLTSEFARRGIDFVVARTWNKDPWTCGPVNRSTEARFKNRNERWLKVYDPELDEWVMVRVSRPSWNPKKLCPICNPGNKRGNGNAPRREQKRKEVSSEAAEEDEHCPDQNELFDEIPF